MNKVNYQLIADRAAEKALATIRLVEGSLTDLPAYDPDIAYSIKQLEPYDALCDRFVRAVEACLQFFRSYELLLQGVNSETVRDGLNFTHKLGLISSPQLWLEMRDIRNRIVHDYLPQQVKKMYELIMGHFAEELFKVRDKITTR